MTMQIDDAFGAAPQIRKLAHELVPLLYDDTLRLARRERRRIGGGATLQTTALAHEAYLKLLKAASFNDRRHFLRAAAIAMRHILINHARDRTVAKRGGGASHVPIDESLHIEAPNEALLLEVNEAVVRLGLEDPRLAQVIECRFFAGFTDQEAARALGVTERTVRRDWVKARTWLRQRLRGSQAP